VPWGLKRFPASGQTHFVTFCCYHRRPLFTAPIPKQVFEAGLERVRRSIELYVYGYVVMPERVYLVLSEPQRSRLADAIRSLKQGVSRRLIGGFHKRLKVRKARPSGAKARILPGRNGTAESRALPKTDL
jgi:putative transposase